MLEIRDLHVKIEDEDREILKGLSLKVPKGEVHAIMGPNGSGKSTLAHVLAGRDGYEVTKGDILWNGESVLEMEPEERAAKGVFLAFQYPVEIPGVASLTFMRSAMNAVRKARGEGELTTPEFIKLIKAKAQKLNIDAMGQSKCGNDDTSHRMRIKKMLKEFEQGNPMVVTNIFRSLQRVQSDYLIENPGDLDG